jgi:hypothetical protein
MTRLDFCQLPTANCQLPTANCQLPTANCQLPTAKSTGIMYGVYDSRDKTLIKGKIVYMSYTYSILNAELNYKWLSSIKE